MPLQNSVGGEGTGLGGAFTRRKASPGINMSKSLQKKTSHKTVKDVCRLHDTTFTHKKDKHNLIIGALKVKPAYTSALEEFTGLVKTTDD